MLAVIDNSKYYECKMDTQVTPLDYTGDIVIAMDPSKTNFAMVIGDPSGNIIQIVEFSGNGRGKMKAEDTTTYCLELKNFLRQYLSKTKLYIAGIEAAITSHRKGENYFANHVSNMVLTEIRAAILDFFMTTYGIKINEINNWSWKHDQLPEGYRGRDQKYSKLYLQKIDPNNPLCGYFNEDACDAYFMYKYIINTMCRNYTIMCNQHEDLIKETSIIYTTIRSPILLGLKELAYNDVFSVQDNINYYANRILEPVFIKVPIKDLDIGEIYKHSKYVDHNVILDEEAAIVIGW